VRSAVDVTQASAAAAESYLRQSVGSKSQQLTPSPLPYPRPPPLRIRGWITRRCETGPSRWVVGWTSVEQLLGRPLLSIVRLEETRHRRLFLNVLPRPANRTLWCSCGLFERIHRKAPRQTQLSLVPENQGFAEHVHPSSPLLFSPPPFVFSRVFFFFTLRLWSNVVCTLEINIMIIKKNTSYYSNIVYPHVTTIARWMQTIIII